MRAKKNVYLVQIGDMFGNSNSYAYIPYAAGTIAAKAFGNPEVAKAYTLAKILFRRVSVSDTVSQIKEPFLVGFSCYVWNYEYNKTVAQELKLIYPDCIILFGGHHVPPDDSLLKDCPYVDFTIHGEGEEVFKKLLLALNGNGDISDVPNISYRAESGETVNTRRERITGTDYPSPYTAGFFDSLLIENPDIHFSCILETNRGCINSCAFCDWGPHKDKVRLFSAERVKGDIDWFSENGIEYIWSADANMGQFDRDIQIAQWLIDAKKKNGYPKRIKFNYAKNRHDNVMRITSMFLAADISKSTTVSFQTLSEKALLNIGRKNMTMDSFSDLIVKYRSEGIPTYTELILGLPGETYQTFVDGIDKLMESGQHSMIEVYDCEMLPNSQLAQPDYRKMHGIKTARIPFYKYHTQIKDEEVREYSEIIVATNDLSATDWINCKLFTVAFQSLHSMGLTMGFAVLLHYNYNVGYSTFYRKVLDRALCNPGSLLGTVFGRIQEAVGKVMSGENRMSFIDESFGDVRWTLEEGAFLSFVTDIDRLYEEISELLLEMGVDGSLLENLVRFQKLLINEPNKTVFADSFDYDFVKYFSSALKGKPEELKREPCRVQVGNPLAYAELKDYAREVVWFGKRSGRTVCRDVTKITKEPN